MPWLVLRPHARTYGSPFRSVTTDALLAGHAYGYAVGVAAPAELEADVVVGTSIIVADGLSELSDVESPESAEE
jgi:hypothetical protein